MNRYPLHLATLVLALAPYFAHATGGAFEINQDCAAVGCFTGDSAGFPVTITHPGTYVLTSDVLVTTPDANAIDIAVGVSPVDIDLNGHTIDGGGACINSPVSGCSGSLTAGFYGINQSFSGTPGVVHVHDGTIRGFTYTNGFSPAGIYLGNAADGTVIEHVNLLENGGNGGNAISAFSNVIGTLHVRDSRISRNDGDGIFASDVNNNKLSAIAENSEFSANSGEGIHQFKKSTVTGCRFYGNGAAGINVADVVAFGQNVFSGNNSSGAQYVISSKRDMGGNVCITGTCP